MGWVGTFTCVYNHYQQTMYMHIEIQYMGD